MNIIRLAKKVESDAVFARIEEEYEVSIPFEICEFLKTNSRGIPKEKSLVVNGKEYLLFGFVSVDEKDKINMISIASRLKNENGMKSVLPFATDGFGNYYGIKFNEGFPTAIVFYEAENGKISFVCNEFREIIQALGLE